MIGTWPIAIATARDVDDGPKATTNISTNTKNGNANSTSIVLCKIRSSMPPWNPEKTPIMELEVNEEVSVQNENVENDNKNSENQEGQTELEF